MKRFLLGTTAAVFLAAPVQAADMPVKAPPLTVAAYNWAGPYAGVHCGGAWGRSSTRSIPPVDDIDFDDSLQSSGWVCGGQLGMNWQSRVWVYGVEGDIGYLGLKKEIVTPIPGDDPRFTQVQYGWYGTLTARAGYAQDRWLAYLKGGAAFARIRNTVGDLENGVPTVEDFSEVVRVRTGWALGGGLEYGVTSNWSAKLEYLYMNFGSDRSSNPDGFVFEHKNEVHTVKLGLNYRIGSGPIGVRN